MALSPEVFPFSGRVALVAGCAGAVGLAIAEALVKEGATVYVAGDLVVTPQQKWRLAKASPGLCIVLPKLRTSVALSEEFGQHEEQLHILVASAQATSVLATAHRDFLLNGCDGEEEPTHVVAVGTLTESASLEELRCEGVVVDSVEPSSRFGGTQEDHASDVARMVLFVCDRSQACDEPNLHVVEEPVELGNISAKALPIPMSRL